MESSNTVGVEVGGYELWVTGPDGYFEPIDGTGCPDAGAAYLLAARVRNWLHLAVWAPGEMPEELLWLPSELRAVDVDPAACGVRVARLVGQLWPPPTFLPDYSKCEGVCRG